MASPIPPLRSASTSGLSPLLASAITSALSDQAHSVRFAIPSPRSSTSEAPLLPAAIRPSSVTSTSLTRGEPSPAQVGEGERLVRARVQGPHHHPPPLERREHLPVDVGQFGHGGCLDGGEEHELGADQRDRDHVRASSQMGCLHLPSSGSRRTRTPEQRSSPRRCRSAPRLWFVKPGLCRWCGRCPVNHQLRPVLPTSPANLLSGTAFPVDVSSIGMIGLIPNPPGIDVSSQVHSVVEDSADDQRVAVTSTDEEVSRMVDLASGAAGTTAREVPGEGARPEFWAGCVSVITS